MQEVSLDGEEWIWVFSSCEEKIQKIQTDKKEAEKKEINLIKKEGILGRRKGIKQRLALYSRKEFQVKKEKARLVIQDALAEITPLLYKDISFLLLREKNLSKLRGKEKELEEISLSQLTSTLESLVLNASSLVEKTGLTKEMVEDIIWVVYFNLAKTLSQLIGRALGEGELSLLEESVITLPLLLRGEAKERKITLTEVSSLPDKEEFLRRRELLEKTLKFPAVKIHADHC